MVLEGWLLLTLQYWCTSIPGMFWRQLIWFWLLWWSEDALVSEASLHGVTCEGHRVLYPTTIHHACTTKNHTKHQQFSGGIRCEANRQTGSRKSEIQRMQDRQLPLMRLGCNQLWNAWHWRPVDTITLHGNRSCNQFLRKFCVQVQGYYIPLCWMESSWLSKLHELHFMFEVFMLLLAFVSQLNPTTSISMLLSRICTVSQRFILIPTSPF